LFWQPVSWQTPVFGPVVVHIFPVAQSRQSPHFGWQAPSSQTRPLSQVIPAQGSTQVPTRQTWPCGHMTPSQPPTQVPALQT
jgi:hypothetical protein